MTQKVSDNQQIIEAQFWAFHKENPAVYDELVTLARDLRKRGYKRFGIGMLWEVIRWRNLMRANKRWDKNTPFALNNNYRAYYARLIMRNEADLANAFDTRKLNVPHHIV